jgi:hypothetical protein
MTLLADSRNGQRSGLLPWTLLVIGSAASLAANVAVAEPSAVGRRIAAWPSCALIGSYEPLMRQVRHAAMLPPGRAPSRYRCLTRAPLRTRLAHMRLIRARPAKTLLHTTRIRL